MQRSACAAGMCKSSDRAVTCIGLQVLQACTSAVVMQAHACTCKCLQVLQACAGAETRQGCGCTFQGLHVMQACAGSVCAAVSTRSSSTGRISDSSPVMSTQASQLVVSLEIAPGNSRRSILLHATAWLGVQAFSLLCMQSSVLAHLYFYGALPAAEAGHFVCKP